MQDLLNEAVESLALAACASADHPDHDVIGANSEGDMPDLLTPISHSGATPLGGRRGPRSGRRCRPKSVAEQQSSSNELLSLPPLGCGEAADCLAELPAHTLHHLVKGRPKRTKTRAPTRPLTDQAQDNDEGLEEFWRTCRTPPGSEEASLSARSPPASLSARSPPTSRSLHSLTSLHSPTLRRDDTMYSVTSGESTPVLLDGEVSRCRSTDNVGLKSSGSPPPSRSSDDVNTMGSMLRDHPLTPEEVEET